MTPIHTILCPTDFSPRAAWALPLASALARDYGARLILLHVVPPVPAFYGEAVLVPPEPHVVREALREQLGRLRPDDPDVRVEHHLRDGDPAGEILALARETECDLIVMGTHGRTGMGRLLLGSVAEHVMRKAPCPVLTVKTPAVVAPVPVPAEAVHAG